MLPYQNTDLAYSLKGLILFKNFPTARIELDLFVGFLCYFVLKVLKMLTAVDVFFLPLLNYFYSLAWILGLGWKISRREKLFTLSFIAAYRRRHITPSMHFWLAKFVDMKDDFR